ncbi:MAG: ABC transporter permease [Pirellulales bacterium]
MWISIKLAAKNLLLHKLRSILTLLGVILGVGSVIAMLAIGEGSKARAVEEIRRLGATNVIIRSVKPGQKTGGQDAETTPGQQKVSRVVEYGLKYADFDGLKATLPTLSKALAVSLFRKDATRGRCRMTNARIHGVTPDYQQLRKTQLYRGRFISAPDIDHSANVAVLGATAAQKLFKFQDPLGKSVLIGPTAFQVVGVLKQQTDAQACSALYIPLSSARWRFGELQVVHTAGSLDFERTQLNEIILTVVDTELVAPTAEMARKLLAKRHPRHDDYELQVPLELLRRAEQEKRIWNMVLGSIAGISLLVGGIGIMNIMLASVTERTREIGIRRALGAKRRDITIQFLVETVVLSATGGVLGIVLGIAIPLVVRNCSEIEAVITPGPVVLAFLISCSIGVAFGLYPARRAALMNPIDAMRQR